MLTGAEGVAAAKAAVAIVQLAEKRGWLDRLKELTKTKHPIVVTGSTGVGKSNFVSSLHSLVPETIDRVNRTAVARRDRISLAGTLFDFTDTPGQAAHAARRMEAYASAHQSDTPFGVINVVCDGYHEYSHSAEEALTSTGGVSPAWLQDHRQLEQVAAAEWAAIMTGKPRWVMTLVTKADLWWPKRDEVLRSYEAGPYWETIRGAAVNGHEILPFSSVNHMFYGKAPMSGTFTSEDRSACLKGFLESLFELTLR